jgi:tetratricopeptide (TPR) repeat protein
LLERQGRQDEAILSYRKAISIAPDLAEAHRQLGAILMDQGQHLEAEASLRQALILKPDWAGVYNDLSVILRDQGRVAEAETSLRRALAFKPDFAEAHNNLGTILNALGRFAEAEPSLRQAITLRADSAEPHRNLGIALMSMGRLAEAEASLRQALSLRPDFAEAHNDLFITLRDQGRITEAEACVHRALSLRPDFAEAINSLATILMKRERLAEAEVSLRRALVLNPALAEIHRNLGVVHQYQGRMVEAEASLRQALVLKPDYAEARVALSFLLLALGRYTEAWPYYESRYHPAIKEFGSEIPDLPYPQWRGEPLAGKSLLIWPEQGFGDYIQFVRYAPLLKERGVTRLTLVCSPPLKALLETATGVDAVITNVAAVPPHDYWSYPLSLPLHFGTTVETVPAAVPYLHALPVRLDCWRHRLPGQGLKVGLVWKGRPTDKNDAHRSMPGLQTLAPLWTVPGTSFISLQKGQGEEEAQSAPTTQPIVSLGSDIRDFADLAAIVAHLDLVICVDTAIAHVAGALGKTCWVLLPARGTDWRWLLGRPDSPWYPHTTRIFRQSQVGNWDKTIAEVAEALRPSCLLRTAIVA